MITVNTAPAAVAVDSAGVNLDALPAADALPIEPHPTTTFRVARVIIGAIVRSLFRLRAEGVDNVPDGPYILIANHLNWVDSFAIVLSLPSEPRLHFLGEVKHIVVHPWQWRLVRAVGGFIPVANGRRDPSLFRHVDTCLARGAALALYPEGRYGEQEGEVGAFKRGFAHFAVDTAVPVVPVAVSGTKDLWLRKRLRVIVGEPIDPRGRSVDEMVRLGRDAVRSLIPEPGAQRGPRLLQHRLTNLFYSGHH